jgi:hypothetical protein
VVAQLVLTLQAGGKQSGGASKITFRKRYHPQTLLRVRGCFGELVLRGTGVSLLEVRRRCTKVIGQPSSAAQHQKRRGDDAGVCEPASDPQAGPC